MLLYLFLGLQGEIVIETVTMTEDRIKIEKDEGKTILTDMIIGDLMNATVGVMRQTLTIEIIRGGRRVDAFTIYGYLTVILCQNTFVG
jgi:hypothetical protein